jgi:hypothetical protein
MANLTFDGKLIFLPKRDLYGYLLGRVSDPAASRRHSSIDIGFQLLIR